MCGDSSRDCVRTAGGPALPRDPLCTFSDAHRNHLFAVYVENNFAACAECHNIFIHVYIILLYVCIFICMFLRLPFLFFTLLLMVLYITC